MNTRDSFAMTAMAESIAKGSLDGPYYDADGNTIEGQQWPDRKNRLVAFSYEIADAMVAQKRATEGTADNGEDA